MEYIDTVFMAKAIIICALMGMFATWRWLVWKLRYNKAKWINYKETKLKVLRELEGSPAFNGEYLRKHIENESSKLNRERY